MRCKCDIVLISVNSPAIIGIYQEKDCVDSIDCSGISRFLLQKVESINLDSTHKSSKILTYYAKKDGKTSDVLALMFDEILRYYTIERIFYANGPGNFSAIKLTHIFLQTLAFINDIELFCADSFYFTKDEFINAYGRIYFYKNKGKIKTTMLDNKKNAIFTLPNVLNASAFSKDCFPLYILPAL